MSERGRKGGRELIRWTSIADVHSDLCELGIRLVMNPTTWHLPRSRGHTESLRGT